MKMNKRFRELIDDMDHKDLTKLYRDLCTTGGGYMKQVLADKIKEIEEQEKRICSTCGNNINPYYVNDYVLMFGPRDFKKRVYFCAMDCMEYFIFQLKTMKKKELTPKR